MNYLTEIKLFNDWLETEDIPSNAIVLWYALMFVANRSGWKEEFSVPFSVLESRTKLNKSTIWRMRRVLIDRGLISVREVGGNQSAMYRICSFENSAMLQLALHRATQTATQIATDAENELHAATLTATVHKLNSVYTEKEKTSKKEKAGAESKERKSCAKKREMPRLNQAQFLAAVNSPWRDLMAAWLEYKRTRRESYRSELGARKCLALLRHLSSDDPQTAAGIIDQSIANNWAGLFPLRTGAHPGQILQPANEERTRSLLEKFGRK